MGFGNGHPTLINNQLADVICQLRFPEISAIGAEPPEQFRSMVADLYPNYTVHKEVLPPKISGNNGQLNISTPPAVYNHQFTSSDGNWRINMTNGFFSIACTRYDRWESFANRLDKPLALFIQLYRPASFTRVGLRYLNFISRKQLSLEGVPFRELIDPAYLGYLGKEGVEEQGVLQSTVDTQFALSGGCLAKIHAGPGMTAVAGQKDPEVKFVLDLDFFMNGNIPVNVSVGALQTLHSQAFPVFRGAVTDKLMNALKG